MSLFKRKRQTTIKDFCRDFYDNQILNPKVGEVNAGEVYSKVVKKNIVELYPDFEKVSLEKLHKELTVLRFELFALAWTHKFISGKNVVIQSAFTHQYLKEKSRTDILNGMVEYNNMIDSATLHWLTGQGKMNLSFNYNTREDLTKQNDKEAKELGLEPDGMANQRLWSENAWR